MKKITEEKEIIKKTYLPFLSESQNMEVDKISNKIYEEWVKNGSNIEDLNEGFFTKVLGGTAGFIIGPSIGKAIARALGINKGILYDLLTSKLVSTALGAAVADSVKKNK